MHSEQIKPCPHCGGAAILNANYSYKGRTFFVFVKCCVCGATGKTYSSADDPEAVEWNNNACNDAITAWNMRTSDIIAQEVNKHEQ